MIGKRGDRFRYPIRLNPGWHAGQPIYRDPVYVKDEWKRKSFLYLKIYFYYQSIKARLQLQKNSFKHYYVDGYFVPQAGQFFCPRTGMRAIQSEIPEVIQLHRKYWARVAQATDRINEFLDSISFEDLSYWVYLYLRRLIIIPNLYSWEFERYAEAQETGEKQGSGYFSTTEWRDYIQQDPELPEAENVS